MITWLVAAGVLLGGSSSVFAQGGPGPRGHGYGGPPKSEQERAERWANCPWAKQPGTPALKSQARGRWGMGASGAPRGKAYRRGLRDGTGPRALQGKCPFVGQTPAQDQR